MWICHFQALDDAGQVVIEEGRVSLASLLWKQSKGFKNILVHHIEQNGSSLLEKVACDINNIRKYSPKGACFKMEQEGFQKTIDRTTFKPKNVNVG